MTEFYSKRGGGVRSHLTMKGHILCQLGHEHVVVAPGESDDDRSSCAPGEGGGRTRPSRLITIRGPASPYDATYRMLVRFDRIRSIVREERPDILEIHSPYFAAAGALLASSCDFGVRTFQWHSDFIDTYLGVLEAQTGRIIGNLARKATLPLWSLVRTIAGACDATLVASPWQMEKLRRHRIPRLHHVTFGIEHDVFRPEARTLEGRARLLALAGRPPSDPCPILIGLGRFAVEKRWDVVIDAYMRVRTERDAVLILIGDGPERQRLEARGRGRVVFPGFERDRHALARLLAGADLLVHGCPFETFGLSIAEALACGLPVVLPDRGGAADVFAASAGASYRSLDVASCAGAIVGVLQRMAGGAGGLREAAAESARVFPSVEQQFEDQIVFYTHLLTKKTTSRTDLPLC